VAPWAAMPIASFFMKAKQDKCS